MVSELGPEILEWVRCDLCGADDAEPVLPLRDVMFQTSERTFWLNRCRNCGLLYLNPRPVQKQIGRYYRDDYAPFARSGIPASVKRRTLRREVDSLWPLLAPPAKVLDIGCATGDLLQAVRERGNPNVLGVEPNEHAAEIARTRWGIEVRLGTLESACLPASSVDVALLAHTLEHLPSPANTLNELRRVLSPHGVAIFWLPNAAALAARILGENWMGYDAPRHFYAFTPATLDRMLTQAGFEIRSVAHEWIGLEWSWGLRLIAHEQFTNPGIDRTLSTLHPLLTAASTPTAVAAAAIRRAGRIRVVAAKTP